MNTILETTANTKKIGKILVISIGLIAAFCISMIGFIVFHPIQDSFTQKSVLLLLGMIAIVNHYLTYKLALPLSLGHMQLEEWVELTPHNPRHLKIIQDELEMALHKEDFHTAAVLRDILAQKEVK